MEQDYPMEVYKLFLKWFEMAHPMYFGLANRIGVLKPRAVIQMNNASEAYLAGYMQAKQEVDEVHDAEPLDLTDSCGNRDCIICGDEKDEEDEPDDLRLSQPDEADECDDPDCPIHGMNWVDGFGYPKTIV